jgi:K+-transporting ATPase ATPase B chain
LAKEQFNIRGREMEPLDTVFIPFTAQTRMCGIDLRKSGGQLRSIRKGSADAIRSFIQNNNGFFPKNVEEVVSELSRQGATPLVVA